VSEQECDISGALPESYKCLCLRRIVAEERFPLGQPDWSRKPPRLLKIPSVMSLPTLADMREFVEHMSLPKKMWLLVAAILTERWSPPRLVLQLACRNGQRGEAA